MEDAQRRTNVLLSPNLARLVVFKIGGSLLEWPAFPERLEALLDEYESSRCLLIVGGGQAADLVRDWDRRFFLGEERAHWLAVRTLTLNAALVCTLLPRAVLVASREAAEAAWAEERRPILDAFACLSSVEQRGRPTTPHCWDATADTISAWIAGEWAADELVLVKSIHRPAGGLREAEQTHAVDPLFRRHAESLPQVSWINLRQPG